MIITHKMDWQKCLSHQIWPSIEKGWKDEDKPIHFFWGLGGNNVDLIREVSEKGEEWWYVDVGYLTQQITRYPEPKIHDFDKTYFRIIRGGIHTTRGKVGNGQRLIELENKGIDVEFKGWYTGETKHILVAPSSQTVTFHTNGVNQDQWIYMVTEELKKHTDREIRVRNKPRPGNEWWNTDIKDDLKDCHCLVTNMSLSAIDAIMNKVPVICAGKNVAAPVCSRNPKFVEKPFRPGRKTIIEWLKYVVENQFTIKEIENGTAYETLKKQNEN
jgi:hypothetical protein